MGLHKNSEELYVQAQYSDYSSWIKSRLIFSKQVKVWAVEYDHPLGIREEEQV